MSEAQTITVDAAARNTSFSFGATQTADFVVNLQSPVSGKKNVALSALGLPNTFQYAVVNATNNQINFNDGAPATAVIASGTYSGTTLAVAVQAAMNSASSGYTVTYSSSTRFFTIARATPFSLLWATGAASPSGTNTSARGLLGFLAVDMTGASSYTSDVFAQFGPSTTLLQLDTAYVTITAGANDRIDFDDTGGLKTATITAGTYTLHYFAVRIQAAMNAVSSSFVVAPDRVTGKLVVSTTDLPFTLLWATGPNAARSARREMGFELADVVVAGSPFRATSVYAPFTNTQTLTVAPDVLGVNSKQTSAGVAYAFAIPIAVAPGITQSALLANASTCALAATVPVSYLHVRLVDTAGALVLLNGSEWNFTLTFT